MKPKSVPIESYLQYVEKVNELPIKQWIYRGHCDASWRIESTLARFYRTHKKKFSEKILSKRELDSARKFRRVAHQYLAHLPAEKDLRAWLAVMQHFGAPTRLIDFTFSPLVALYFAAVESVKLASQPSWDQQTTYEPFHVHAIHVNSVRDLTKKRCNAGGLKIKLNPEQDHYKIGNSEDQKTEFVGLFEGSWQNPRQTAQQGLFMITSKITMDVHRFLQSLTTSPQPFESPWLIFEFKGGEKMYYQIIDNLISANLTAASLFPGIEGLAKSMYLRMYETVKQLD